MKKSWIVLTLVVFALSSVLVGCAKKEAADTQTLKIGASPVPHAELLELIKDDLKAEGIELEIVEFTDYVTPNLALNDGDIDVNFFQHVPYMNSFATEHNLKLVSAGTVHVEPLGLYSKSITSLDALKDGAKIAIPNDATNEGRSLLLLHANGIIQLEDPTNLESTPENIIENPKNLVFEPIDAAQLPRTLEDVDASVINTNYALEAGLNPLEDALLLEGADSPYANILTVLESNKDDARVKTLLKVLQSDKVKNFITEKYKGAVVPVF